MILDTIFKTIAGPFNRSTPTNIIPKSKTTVASLQAVKLPSSFINKLKSKLLLSNTHNLFVMKANKTDTIQATTLLRTLETPKTLYNNP